MLPHFYHLPIDQFVLDFANREMADIECLKSLPKDKEVQIGVLDIRTSMIESPEQVADRIRKVLKVVPPERVYLSTDCGMKPLPRMVAKLKLKALADGAKIVRKEIGVNKLQIFRRQSNHGRQKDHCGIGRDRRAGRRPGTRDFGRSERGLCRAGDHARRQLR